MITPPYLKIGDTVAIVAPAGTILNSDISKAIETYKSWGLNVVEGKNLYGKDFKYSGSDEQRTKDLQEMLDRDDIKAIFCARGGYGTIRIIDNLDFNKFIKNPKWIIGYSDITALHLHLNMLLNIESLHAIMPTQFAHDDANEAISALKKILFGETIEYNINIDSLNINGEAYGKVIGGNLSLLYALNSNPEDVPFQNHILFIEEVGEYNYHIDRMILNFKRSGKLSRIKALLVGGMTNIKDDVNNPFGKNYKQIINSYIKDFNIPLCFNIPAGHFAKSMPIILGRNATISVSDKNCFLKFDKAEEKIKKSFSKFYKPILKTLLFFLIFFILIWAFSFIIKLF